MENLKDLLYIPSGQWSLPVFMRYVQFHEIRNSPVPLYLFFRGLDDSYRRIWGSIPYYEVPPEVGAAHSFVHLIRPGLVNPPNDPLDWRITPLESTEGHCLQIQVKYGKAALYMIQEERYPKFSSWSELSQCFERIKGLVRDPNLHLPPIYYAKKLSLDAGDCVIIPPGIIFFFYKRKHGTIISGCKFLCKETLHLSYPWIRLQDFSNADATVSKYWAVMKGVVGKSTVMTVLMVHLIYPMLARDTKLWKIMEGDDSALFQGGKDWVNPS